MSARPAKPSPVERQVPNSPEAEQGVISCLLQSPADCIPLCIDKFTPGPIVFFDLKHRTIYEALLDMYDAREPIDTTTFSIFLRTRAQLEDVGGLPYLMQLADYSPSVATLSHYANIVFDKYVLRRLLQTCAEVQGRIYEHEGEVQQLMDDVETQILAINSQRVNDAIEPFKTLVHRAIATIEQYHERKGLTDGISTGFADLDNMTGGFKPGEMIVIAGRPGSGKSAASLNIAEHVAVELKHPVGIFSLEMSRDSLAIRTICSRARINLRNVRDGYLVERDFPKINSAAGKLASAPLYIDDTSSLSVTQLRARARRMVSAYNIKLLVIDYLQLLHSTNRRAESRQQEVADISRGIKVLAMDLGVPVIVLSQLSRMADKEDRRPRLSDLRESGAIEADADLVGILFSKEDEDRQRHDYDARPITLAIEKQRQGPTGDVHLVFLRAFTRFEAAAKEVSHEPPDDRQAEFDSYQQHNDP